MNALASLGLLITAQLAGFACGANVVDMVTNGATVTQGGTTAAMGILALYSLIGAVIITAKHEWRRP